MRDLIFKRLLFICCILILLISAGMIYSLVSGSIPALNHYGFFQFIGSTEWDPHPDRETYGALSFIVGTLLTSFLALIFCIPFSLPVALFTGEFFKGKKIATFYQFYHRLAGGIPSIVYGLWGFYTSVPSSVELGINSAGIGILTSSIILCNHDYSLCIFSQWRVHLDGPQRTERSCI